MRFWGSLFCGDDWRVCPAGFLGELCTHGDGNHKCYWFRRHMRRENYLAGVVMFVLPDNEVAELIAKVDEIKKPTINKECGSTPQATRTTSQRHKKLDKRGIMMFVCRHNP